MNDCPICGAQDGYECAPGCDCDNCEAALRHQERQKNEDDGREYGHPGDRLAGRE